MVQTATEQLSFVEGLDFWRDQVIRDGQSRSVSGDLRAVIAVLARDVSVNPEAIRKPVGRVQKRLRQIAIYLTNTHFGHPMAHVTDVLGLSRQVGVYCCRGIEDERDCPEFDQWLCGIELRLDQYKPGVSSRDW